MENARTAADRIRRIVRVLNRRAQAETGAGSPTRSEQAVLAWLDEIGVTTPTVLAKLEQVRPQSMTQTLDGLSNRGLISRDADPIDRRKIKISLTADGRRALQRGRMMRQQWLSDGIETLLNDNERELLISALDLLDRIVAK